MSGFIMKEPVLIPIICMLITKRVWVFLFILLCFFIFAGNNFAADEAIYSINEVKNTSGEAIPQVKIYVDGNYTHHYAPEVLTFCETCHCDDDKNVDCNFGEHTIKLEKSGYLDWVESVTVAVGESYSVYPVMVAPSPTPTSEPTLTPTSTPTPTEVPATAVPTPTDTPTNTPAPNSYENIFVSEFMAWPESGNEWVELFNNNDSEVNLFGWYLDDITGGGKSPRPISGTISAKSYRQFFLDDFFLNNDGDDVRLLDGSQAEKDKKSFSSSTKGKSWSKDSSGDWCQMVPTPNSANSDCPNSAETPTLSPTPTLNLTLTPTPKTTLTPSRSLSASVSGEVMGEEAASGENRGSSDNSLEEIREIKKLYQPPEKKKSLLFSLIAIGGGLALIFFSVFSYLKSKQ